MSHEVTGGCLCGAVRFTATLPSRALTVCWCTQCLRQNSGPLVTAADAEAWQITGEVAAFRASDHASRGFCAACGSTIFWQEDGDGPAFALGALDARDGYRVARTVHEDTRPDGLSALFGAMPTSPDATTPREGDRDDAV